MESKYSKLVSFIPALENDDFGEWLNDHEHEGTPKDPIQFPFVNYSQCVRELENEIYEFNQNNPEYEMTRYGDILAENGIKWGMDSMSAVDVSNLDAKVIMALLMGAVRAERFCDGALLKLLRSGVIVKWLLRLKELV